MYTYMYIYLHIYIYLHMYIYMQASDGSTNFSKVRSLLHSLYKLTVQSALEKYN